MWRFRRDWVAGAILLPVGLWLLSERLYPQLTPVIPLVGGVLLLVVVLITKNPAMLVIGGVLTGLGVGILVARGGTEELAVSGLLACLGGGFALAWLVGLLLHIREVRFWPIVPAAVLVALAAALAVMDLGPEAQKLAHDWWPIVLVAYGAWLMFMARLDAGREEVWIDEDESEAANEQGRLREADGRRAPDGRREADARREEYRLPAGEPPALRPGLASADPSPVAGAGVIVEPLGRDQGDRPDRG